MAKEILRALEDDAQRLLWAGGHAAAHDEGLAARRELVAPLAAKLPALGKLLAQLDAVRAAPPAGAAAELLSLAAMIGQLRAAQAQPASAGPSSAVPRGVAVASPLGAEEAQRLAVALFSRAKENAPALRAAIESRRVLDVRLLAGWLVALQNPAWAPRVVTGAFPHLGEALRAPLARLLRLQGGAADAWRLAALVEIEGQASLPRLTRALAEGSPELREAALRALGQLAPAEAEPFALAILRDDAPSRVRIAAIYALGQVSSEAALSQLFALLEQEPALSNPAHQVLRESRYGAVDTQLLARLRGEPPAKGRKKRAPLPPAALHWIELAGERRLKEAAPLLLPLWRDKKHPYRAEAGAALAQLGQPEVIDLLTAELPQLTGAEQLSALDAVFQLPPAEAYHRLVPLLAHDSPAREDLAQLILAAFTDDLFEGNLPLEQYARHLRQEPRWLAEVLGWLPDPLLGPLVLDSLDALLSAAQPSAERLHALLSPYLTGEWVGPKRRAKLTEPLLFELLGDARRLACPAWEDTLLGFLLCREEGLVELQQAVVEHLTGTRAARLVPVLLEALAAQLRAAPKKAHDRVALWLESLEGRPDPAIAPALLALVEDLPAARLDDAYDLLAATATPALLPALAARRAQKRRGKEATRLDQLLRALSSPA